MKSKEQNKQQQKQYKLIDTENIWRATKWKEFEDMEKKAKGLRSTMDSCRIDIEM